MDIGLKLIALDKKLIKSQRTTMYKNNCTVLSLTKGSCKFTISDFHAKTLLLKHATNHIEERHLT
jgi:hypothetical protein